MWKDRQKGNTHIATVRTFSKTVIYTYDVSNSQKKVSFRNIASETSYVSFQSISHQKSLKNLQYIFVICGMKIISESLLDLDVPLY